MRVVHVVHAYIHIQYRIRKVLKKAFNGGRCYKLKEQRQCNEHGCRKSPRHTHTHARTRTRTRTHTHAHAQRYSHMSAFSMAWQLFGSLLEAYAVTIMPHHTPCQHAPTRTRAHAHARTAVNCKVSDWGAWQLCSVSCGGGKQSRMRNILQKREFSGRPCPGTRARACTCAWA